ncbi:MAG: hypothetical protein ACT4PT_12795 [Methanobacteriota archaeon]
MRTLLFALVLVGALFVTGPAAEARGFCSDTVDSWCPGYLCLKTSWGTWSCAEVTCVREPCP